MKEATKKVNITLMGWQSWSPLSSTCWTCGEATLPTTPLSSTPCRQLRHLHRHHEDLQDDLLDLPQGHCFRYWSNKTSLCPQAWLVTTCPTPTLRVRVGVQLWWSEKIGKLQSIEQGPTSLQTGLAINWAHQRQIHGLDVCFTPHTRSTILTKTAFFVEAC